jgi:predicted ATPase with chaperone activity
MGLSARGLARTLRVARTIADLDDIEDVTSDHVAEALSFRRCMDDTETPGPLQRIGGDLDRGKATC